jgi:hypothetical protein
MPPWSLTAARAPSAMTATNSKQGSAGEINSRSPYRGSRQSSSAQAVGATRHLGHVVYFGHSIKTFLAQMKGVAKGPYQIGIHGYLH